MLREITEVTRNIVVLIVAAVFIELILPQNDFRRYIRMVIGLLIILTLLSAVQEFAGRSPGLSTPLFLQEPQGGDHFSGEGERLFHQGLQMEYRVRMEAEAERVAGEFLGPGVAVRADVMLEAGEEFNPRLSFIRLYLREQGSMGGVDAVVIEIKPGEGSPGDAHPAADERRPLQQHVARYFQLGEGQVEVIDKR